MYKKFLNGFLAVALVVAGTMFTSCQDYDEDIKDLREQISAQNANLTSLINEKIASIESEISSLDKQLADLDEAYKAADEVLKGLIESAEANAQAYADMVAAAAQESAQAYADAVAAAAEQAAKDYALIQAQQAEAAAIAAAEAAIAQAKIELEAELATAVAALDNRIDGVEDEIAALKTDLLARIAEVEAAFASDLGDMQTTIEGDMSALYTYLTGLIGEMDDAVADILADIEEIKARLDANDIQIQQLIAADAALQLGIDEAKAAAAKAQAQADLALALAQDNYTSIQNLITQVNGLIDNVGDLYDGLESDLEKLTSVVNNLNTVVESLSTALTELTQVVNSLSSTVTDLSKTVADLESQISIINSTLDDILKEMSNMLGDITSLQGDVKYLYDSNKAILARLDALEGGQTDIEGYLATLYDLIVQNQADTEAALADLEKEMQEAIASVYTALEALEASLKEEIKNQVDAAIAAAIAAANSYTDDAVAGAVAGANAYTDAAVAALDALMQGYLADEVSKLTEYIDSKISELDGKIDTANGRIDALDLDVTELWNYANGLDLALSQLQRTVSTISQKIDALESALADLNQFFVLGDRLTSLVFAPTAYVNGIEAICFNDVVLSYTAWTIKEGEAPVQDGDTYELPIPDQVHVEEYLYSPSHVNISSIASLAYVSNTATEISTKAVSDKAPIKVKDYEITKIENGVSVLAVTVELVDELPTAENTFTTVALKATIADEYKLDSEKGTEVAVFSDWARVYNVAGEATPYIHNAAYTTDPEEGEEVGDEHWYDYETIYALGGTESDPAVYPGAADAPEVTIDSYVVKDVEYTGTFDLNDIVVVCDKEGNFYDLDTYGFAFEFTLVDFYCVNDSTDTEETPANQADYASITNGVISSVGYRDAIGKYPVVQITLVDTNNGNAIVDVKYVAIHWTDEAATYELGKFTLDGSVYDTCGASYDLIISGVDLQRKLAGISEISLEELATTYTLVGLFAEPYDGTNEVDETLGTVSYVYVGESGFPGPGLVGTGTLDNPEVDPTTYGEYCLVWTLAPTIDQDIYDAGEMAFTAYGAFVNETGDNYVTFELYTDFSIAQMELLFDHNQPYWSTGVNDFGYMARIANPTVETDAIFGMETSAQFATTQLVCNLYIGYIKDGVTPSGTLSTVEEYMINFGELYFRLDETRAEELAAETGTSVADWTFNDTDMNLYYKGEEAAHIQMDYDVNAVVCYLYDGAISRTNPRPEGTAGTATATPSEGAKLLVGKFVPMVMYSTWCGCTQILEQFDVAFMTPLALESSETVEVTLTDIYAGGSSSEASLDNTIKLVEYAVQNHRTVWSNYEADPSDETLVGWYGVQAPVFDVENATTNLTLDGGVSDEEDFENWTVQLSDIKTMDGDAVYTIEYDSDTNEIIYYNHSGTAITQSFKICIPVTIATKWQDVIALNVIVTVEPGI